MELTLQIEGLKEFRKALRDSINASPRELTKALKTAGEVLPDKIRQAASFSSQIPASVGRPRASGTKARIPVKARHALPVEFAKHGRAAATLSARYGPPPRFGYKALERNAKLIEDRVFDGLKEVITVHGWFR